MESAKHKKGLNMSDKTYSRGVKFIFFCLFVLMALVFLGLENKKKEIVKKKVETEHWVTIFVHGSFGAVLGFLNTRDVMNDNVAGTKYKKVVGKMRKNPFFFRDQPLLERGLVKVSPSYDLESIGNKKYAAYPLLKAFDDINNEIKPGEEKNYYYTFGWSGLLSQRRRYVEAIRFYNAVSHELDAFEEQGIFPKIRIITHSHGGNLVAYIAEIDKSLEKGDAFFSLPCIEEALKAKGQKRWDYKPERRSIFVEELILWGMPVQPETECLFAAPVFKNVYHFYSDDDLVQRIDWVSTKKGYSDRRFDLARICAGKNNRMVQSRIMVEQDLSKTKDSDENQKKIDEGASKKSESFWSVLFSGGALVTPSSQDPTHKELWFFSWYDEKPGRRKFILSPLPAAAFSPVFVELIKKNSSLNDVDINIKNIEGGIEFDLIRHNDQSVCDGFCIKKDFLANLGKNVNSWRAKEMSHEEIFNLMSTYTNS